MTEAGIPKRNHHILSEKHLASLPSACSRLGLRGTSQQPPAENVKRLLRIPEPFKLLPPVRHARVQCHRHQPSWRSAALEMFRHLFHITRLEGRLVRLKLVHQRVFTHLFSVSSLRGSKASHVSVLSLAALRGCVLYRFNSMIFTSLVDLDGGEDVSATRIHCHHVFVIEIFDLSEAKHVLVTVTHFLTFFRKEGSFETHRAPHSVREEMVVDTPLSFLAAQGIQAKVVSPQRCSVLFVQGGTNCSRRDSTAPPVQKLNDVVVNGDAFAWDKKPLDLGFRPRREPPLVGEGLPAPAPTPVGAERGGRMGGTL